MSRLPAKNKEYMKEYYKSPIKRQAKKNRDNDRYAYEKKNWPIPAGKELGHKKIYARGKATVISKKSNRVKAAKTTERILKKRK